MCKLWVKLYLGQKEDSSLGDNTSDSSERLHQSGNGGRSICKILLKGGFNEIIGLLCKIFLLVTMNWCHHRGFSVFLVMKRFKDWDHEISSWKYLSEDLLHQFPWCKECLTLFTMNPLQQVQQHRVQSPQRQMANAFVVQSQANALGEHQFVSWQKGNRRRFRRLWI